VLIGRMPVEADLLLFDLDSREFLRAPKSFLQLADAAKHATPSGAKAVPTSGDDADDSWHLASPLLQLRQTFALLSTQRKLAGRVFDCAIARALLRFQIATFGNYRPHLKAAAPRDRALNFDAAAHVAARPRRVRAWLNRLAQTQMRESFLRERAGMMFTNTPLTGQFENAISSGGSIGDNDAEARCARCGVASDQQFALRGGELLCDACDSARPSIRKLFERVSNRVSSSLGSSGSGGSGGGGSGGGSGGGGSSGGSSASPAAEVSPPVTAAAAAAGSVGSVGSNLKARLASVSGRKTTSSAPPITVDESHAAEPSAAPVTGSLKRMMRKVADTTKRVGSARSQPTSPRDDDALERRRSSTSHTATDEAKNALVMAGEAELLASQLDDKEKAARILEAVNRAKMYSHDLLAAEAQK
jgi:uncharacterized membrane protein YgcG